MRTVIVIPTYNERENISSLLDRIDSLGLENLETVVVDDNSPDGTWRIVKNRMREDAHLHLLHRTGARGRGLAGAAGFKYALNIGGAVVIEMDGDLSHDPSYIPDFLKAVENFGVILGSRFIEGGGSQRRSFLREFISRMAALYIRIMLGFRVKDPTSGFRCFRREVLEKINLSTLNARGPFIVTEVLFRCHRKGFRIGEIPIVFRERAQGRSKLGFGVLLRNIVGVLKLKLTQQT
jgi:dolichol-phosphate mannosyltransferase